LVIDKRFGTEHLIATNSTLKCNSTNLSSLYMTFETAKSYVIKLQLKSRNEYIEWCRSEERPHNIPSKPQIKYKDEWTTWGEWLGTGRIADQYRNFLPFEDALHYVRNLNFKSSTEWRVWSKSGNRPQNIPGNPASVYKNDGWLSWMDWLGTSIGFDGQYLSHTDASDFVVKCDIKSNKEWRVWSKSGNRPQNIPSSPDKVYKNSGWVSWPDFLQTYNGYDFLDFEEAHKIVLNLNLCDKNVWDSWRDFIKSPNKPNNIPSSPESVYKDSGWESMSHWVSGVSKQDYLPFIEAREYVVKLNLKNQKEWADWVKSNGKSANIPSTPSEYYKGEYKNLNDWIGSDHVFWKDRKILQYQEAKEYVGRLGLKNRKEYSEYLKDNNILDLPLHPNLTYKKNGWLSWEDYLGVFYGFDNNFLSFTKARDYVRSLNLGSNTVWREWSKSGNRPPNIPGNPNAVYLDSGWISFGDWLGYAGDGKHSWQKADIINYIKSLQSELLNLEPIELITIINSNNLSKKIKELGSLGDLLSTQAGTKSRKNVIDKIIDGIEKTSEEVIETEDSDKIDPLSTTLTTSNDVDTPEEEEVKTLEPLNQMNELHMLDNKKITASLDNENVDFLMKNNLKKTWNKVLNNEFDIEVFRNETGGINFTIMKDKFFEEYEEVNKIQSPPDYIFKYQPNLMQKLITYRLLKEKRYGNWSGTGAGKTLSAIFAGRYAKMKNTLIVCNNSTVNGWVNSIDEYFKNNTVYVKQILDDTDTSLYTVADKYNVNLKDGDNNYFILNYETFQQEDSEYIVSELLKNNTVDYIILDEIQNVKQRDDDKQSTRRDVVNKLLIHASDNNDDLMIMAMSATPIINNLTEPKKLIELLTSESHDDLETTENITNGIEMYKALTRHGLRYKPNYGISINEEIVEIDGSDLSGEIIKIPKGAVIPFEKILLDVKLDSISDKIKKGTLIYTHYVTEFSHLIGDYVENLGFSVGYYTGLDKSGLKLFKEGKIDVLVGSAPVGTGVDGIQYVCDTLIPIILPWTSSEYDQLVGRVNRQGSKFGKVNIYIPQVTIQLDNGIWSWDKKRHNIIKYKATLADLAVDGRIPKNLLPSKSKLVESAKKELKDWVNRLNNGDIITFEREELKIPLNPKQMDRSRNELGDFSDMNKKWSTSRSDNTHKRLSEDPTEWYYYHSLYSDKRKTWSEIPYVEIAKKINSRPDWIVGDFGCGENLLSKEITNKIHAFDHVAVDDDVIACDISNVPIEDGVLDVAVFSLALMGSNHQDYFKEAYRTLKTYGNIFVCEPSKKWLGREDELTKQLESAGFKCFDTMKNTDKFIYIDGVKY
jgi:superfamily II DNA or RNA helicase